MVRFIAVVIAGVLAVTGLVVVGNDFRFDLVEQRIPVAGGELDAVLATPRSGQGRGLVVMVHGDGPVDATQDGLYAPWFEAAADAGYATLSWSKPGVGDSSGNWLEQNMDARASEVGAAIDWAKGRGELNHDRIVLWGASQAGWVVPKVISSRDDIDAVVGVGVAVNWLRQGRFNLVAELEQESADETERARCIAASDRVRELLESPSGYQEYLSENLDRQPMSQARWNFVVKNLHADATDDLRAAANRETQVLLMLGDDDRFVDVDETESVYRSLLGDHVSVARFPAAHSMARPVVEDVPAVGMAVAVVWPRALLAAGVTSSFHDFLAGLG